MKRYLTLLLMILGIAFSASAEDYVVYHVVGAVKSMKNQKEKVVAPKDSVSTETEITIPQGGRVEILNAATLAKYDLKIPGKHRIGEIIPHSKRQTKGLNTFVELLRRLFDNRYYVNDDHVIVDREVELVGVSQAASDK